MMSPETRRIHRLLNETIKIVLSVAGQYNKADLPSLEMKELLEENIGKRGITTPNE